ncbi:cytochrome-c peroxidase [Thiomonas sp.]
MNAPLCLSFRPVIKATFFRAALAAGVTLAGLGSAFAFGEFPSKVPVPADNPMTPQKIALGKQLYFDPRISLSGNVSCDSCHRVTSNGSDSLPLSFGVLGRVDVSRHAPTVFNAAFNTVQFWDGRAKSLEGQAKGPLLNPIEMGMPNGAAVVHRLEEIKGYSKEFVQVFGVKDPMTFEHVVQAISTYERTLVTPDSAYDRYVKGDKSAMSTSAVQGMRLVKSEGCVMCHSGAMFDNPGTPMGTGWYQKFPVYAKNPACSSDMEKYDLMKDPGRFDVTHKVSDEHKFKVPSWRNVALEAPYFHNGSVQKLSDAIRIMAVCELNKSLTDGQVQSISAFMNSLTGKFPKETLPREPQTPGTTIMMHVAKLEKTAEETKAQ